VLATVPAQLPGADIAQLRAHPQVFGPVALDPTVSRLVDTLAADPSGTCGKLLPKGGRAAA
jgi:hypothetical protein